MNLLTVEKLHKSFGNKILFNDITLVILLALIIIIVLLWCLILWI